RLMVSIRELPRTGAILPAGGAKVKRRCGSAQRGRGNRRSPPAGRDLCSARGSHDGGMVMKLTPRPDRWPRPCGAAMLLLTALVTRAAVAAADNAATGTSGGSCCPEGGLLKGTMGAVVMAAGGLLIVSL